MENYPTTNKNNIQAYINGNRNIYVLRCQAKKSRFQHGRYTRATIFIKETKRPVSTWTFVHSHRKKGWRAMTHGDSELGYFFFLIFVEFCKVA